MKTINSLFKALIAFLPAKVMVYILKPVYIDCLGGQNWMFQHLLFIKIFTNRHTLSINKNEKKSPSFLLYFYLGV